MKFGKLGAFDLSVNGACVVELSGEAETSSMNVNGAGSIKAFNFQTVHSDITINGTASCEVYATDTLDVEMNGIGAVTYDGNPKTVNTGSGIIGSIKKR